MDKRVGAGVGLFLALEVMNQYQLALPPLYGSDSFDSQDVIQATKFVAIYILLIAILTGAVTSSPYPIVLPAIALGVVYCFYMYELGKRGLANTTADTEDE